MMDDSLADVQQIFKARQRGNKFGRFVNDTIRKAIEDEEMKQQERNNPLVKILNFSEGGLVWWGIKHIGDGCFEVKEVDGRTYKFNRNQAHLLKLYLEEHLK